tara:strand:+ start:213 stop:911 length:699 start_codon:yes stop_codon:yes gene_type:complete
MSDWMDELERLAELHAKGILSQEEFDVEKQKLLSGKDQTLIDSEVNEPENRESNNQRIRYDLSELDAVVRKMIFTSLEEAQIDFEIAGTDPSKDPMEINKQNEDQVDEIIAEWEDWGDRMSSDAQRAQLAQQGDLNSTTCELCGDSPAAEIVLRRTVGMVLVMSNYQSQLVLCESCGESATKEFQKQTALKGWTSLYSAALNPFYIASNAKNRRKHKKTLEELEGKNFRIGF